MIKPGENPNIEPFRCKFEPLGVTCDNHSLCTFCGWNPGVKSERVRVLREQVARGETPHATARKREPGKCALGFHWNCRNCVATNCEKRETR